MSTSEPVLTSPMQRTILLLLMLPIVVQSGAVRETLPCRPCLRACFLMPLLWVAAVGDSFLEFFKQSQETMTLCKDKCESDCTVPSTARISDGIHVAGTS